MIKRYGHINIGMLATKGGDWVKYDDIAHLLEEKTIEQHRSEFEQWAAKEGLRMTRRSDGKYVAPFTAIAWRAWQEAVNQNAE